MRHRMTIAGVVLVALPLSSAAAAAPQSTDPASPQSVERVKGALDRTPAHSLKYDVRMPAPAAIFRTSVNQRTFTITIVEQLRKGFELTPLQRQSADWSARCCGVNLLTVANSLEKAWRRRQERNAREQVKREAAEVRARAAAR
jgi:hypothetical protein